MTNIKFFRFGMENPFLKNILARAHLRTLCARANFLVKMTFCEIPKNDCFILARSARASARAVSKCAPMYSPDHEDDF